MEVNLQNIKRVALFSFLAYITNISCMTQAVAKKELKIENTIECEIEGMVGVIPKDFYHLINAFKNNKLGNTKYSNIAILHGPPGNGKSTLAKKFAELTDSAYLKKIGPDILTEYQASGQVSINKLFDDARNIIKFQNKKVVLVIEEFDAIARSDNNTSPSLRSHEEATQKLWDCIDDNHKEKNNIFIILNTNKFNKIHPNIFDRVVHTILLPNSDVKMRKEIIEFYAKKLEVKLNEILLDKISKETEGLSNRSLEMIVEKIYFKAANENHNIVNFAIVDEAINAEKKKPKLLNDNEKSLNEESVEISKKSLQTQEESAKEQKTFYEKSLKAQEESSKEQKDFNKKSLQNQENDLNNASRHRWMLLFSSVFTIWLCSNKK